MKISVFIIILLISLLSCSLIPNNSSTEETISLEGTWQSTYLRDAQITIEDNPAKVEQTSTLTIEDNQYQFVFDPPMAPPLFYSEAIEQISGTFKIIKNAIFFYDSTSQELRQELSFSIRRDSLIISYPILSDTLRDSSIVRPIPAGAIPWGYAMFVWEPFIKID